MAKLDESQFINKTTTKKYPYIKLLKVSDVTPLVVRLVGEGDTQIVAEKDGKTFVVGSLRLTMKNVNSIIRTHKDVVLVGETEEHYIKDCNSFLKVMIDNGYDYIFDS